MVRLTDDWKKKLARKARNKTFSQRGKEELHQSNPIQSNPKLRATIHHIIPNPLNALGFDLRQYTHSYSVPGPWPTLL